MKQRRGGGGRTHTRLPLEGRGRNGCLLHHMASTSHIHERRSTSWPSTSRHLPFSSHAHPHGSDATAAQFRVRLLFPSVAALTVSAPVPLHPCQCASVSPSPPLLPCTHRIGWMCVGRKAAAAQQKRFVSTPSETHTRTRRRPCWHPRPRACSCLYVLHESSSASEAHPTSAS